MTKAPLSWLERQIEDPKTQCVYEEERLVMDANETLLEAMEHSEVSRAELANRIGVSRALITQLLSGTRNMTLRTLARLAFALGKRVDIQVTNLYTGEFKILDVAAPAIRATRPAVIDVELAPCGDGSETAANSELACAA